MNKFRNHTFNLHNPIGLHFPNSTIQHSFHCILSPCSSSSKKRDRMPRNGKREAGEKCTRKLMAIEIVVPGTHFFSSPPAGSLNYILLAAPLLSQQ